MLTFEGETGPYVQYTHARACSLLRRGNFQPASAPLAEGALDSKEAWAVITLLNGFPEVIERAADNFDPSQIGKYVIDLAQSFNKFYANVRILAEEEDIKASRLQLVAAVVAVLKEGLRLLGLAAPEEM